MLALQKSLRSFIVENYLFGQENGLRDSDSFLDLGIIDSTGVLELVSHIESEYLLKIDSDEIVPDNFDSVEKLAAFVLRKQASLGPAVEPVMAAKEGEHAADR